MKILPKPTQDKVWLVVNLTHCIDPQEASQALTALARHVDQYCQEKGLTARASYQNRGQNAVLAIPCDVFPEVPSFKWDLSRATPVASMEVMASMAPMVANSAPVVLSLSDTPSLDRDS